MKFWPFNVQSARKISNLVDSIDLSIRNARCGQTANPIEIYEFRSE